ncbi:MAG: hypothetical protein M3063_17325, partial [Actinomycetota bacterium]|nr:hypothetical protein [Actinomycetota bacterium]
DGAASTSTSQPRQEGNTMTHDRLIHLAELAEEAADYSDNPSWSRQLSDAARTARHMADVEARAEQDMYVQTLLDDLHELLGR